MKTIIRSGTLASSAGLVLLLAGCGGGSGAGDGGSVFAEGVFLDSPVEGLRYEVGSLIDFTDADGGFRYLPGRMISFYIGDILLGSAQGAPVLTPVQIVPGASGVGDDRVTNIIRFLQTLDADYDPDNGIRIAESTYQALLGQSLSFASPTAVFANDSDVQFLIADATASLAQARMRLVPAITAQARMRATLEGLQSPGRTPPDTLGALAISGQASPVGAGFTPAPELGFSNITTGFSIIEWNEPRPSAPDQDAAVRFDIRFNANPFLANQIAQITLTWEHQILGVRSYGVACSGGSEVFLSVNGCPDVTIDLVNSTVDFDSRILSLAGDINSTIILTGILDIP